MAKRPPANRIDVSIIVVAWNVAPYIAQAVQSCLDQTLKTIEIVIVENASTDGTREIAEKLIAGHPNAPLVANATNTGLGPARNQGMALARGEYFAFLDGDDWLEPDAMEAAFECAKTHDADLVMYDYARHYEDGRVQPGRNRKYLRGGLCKTFEERAAAAPASSSACMKLYRRKFVEAEGFRFADSYYEDVDWAFFNFVRAPRLATLPRSIYNYRLRQGSILRSPSGRHREIFDRWHSVLDFLDSRAPSLDPRWRLVFEAEMLRTLEALMRSPARGTLLERIAFAGAAREVLQRADPACALELRWLRKLRYRAFWRGRTGLAMALLLATTSAKP